MGYSQYFEVWPADLASRLTGDVDVWAAFRGLWGQASGMQYWFEELDDEDLEEFLPNVPSAAVDRLRAMLSESDEYSLAFLEKSLSEHEAALSSAFGQPDGKRAAYLAINGGDPIGMSSGFRVATPVQCADLHQRLLASDLRSAYSDVASDRSDRHPAFDSLWGEVQELVALYGDAASGGHGVITGVPWGA